MIDLKRIAKERFGAFGPNKKREITRLIYEISKRGRIPYQKVLNSIPPEETKYYKIKKQLLTLRFPYSFSLGEKITPYLPKLEVNPENAVEIKRATDFAFNPKNIYIEAGASRSYLAKRLKDYFPNAIFKEIGLLKDFIKAKPGFDIEDYNKRCDNIFLIKERYDFFKICPCTKSAVCCGYNIFNLGFGCIYECVYCYLQEYTNCPGIILPANIEDFFEKFNVYKRPGMRIGTGEFTDSLALDDITQYSRPLIEFFNRHSDVTFELKTKSNNIDNLVKVKHRGNTVISWSLNPERIIKENEFYSAALGQRLKAASECARAGYRIGFHFDPIIYYKGWLKDYENLVNLVFDKISHKKIAWMSLGTFRFNRRLKTVIENRFPENKILDEELLMGFDNKLRYPTKLRYFMYKNMLYWIRKRYKGFYVYLCMENANITKTVKI